MTNDQKQVRDWMIAFGQETPEKPVIPSLEVRKLRAKLIIEEGLIELIAALGFDIKVDGKFLTEDSYELVSNYQQELVEIADGCEDLKVVTEGTLVACGLLSRSYIGDPLFDEVMRSNWSKMWTRAEITSTLINTLPDTAVVDGRDNKWLVKDESGKVIKSPSYSPANLQPIIDTLK